MLEGKKVSVKAITVLNKSNNNAWSEKDDLFNFTDAE
jgi:hypothetical protein